MKTEEITKSNALIAKPKLKLYFNPLNGHGLFSVHYVGEGNPPPVPKGLDWYRLMYFMPWELVKVWKHTKRLDHMFDPAIPISKQTGDL